MRSVLKYLSTGFLAALILLPAGARAQDNRTVPSSHTEMQLSFAPLVKRTAGAVVNVYAERIVQRRLSPFAGDPFFEQFFGQQMPNRTEKQSSLGSGVIVTAGGLVVTNNHVIDGADDIKVALADGREFSSKVLMKDDRVDLAVLQIDAKEQFPVLPLGNSDKIEVGDLVLAIGNPFGVGQTVTSGIVSGLARNQVTQGDFGFFIQTDASINPGNSGGALMNMAGELIGINVAIASSGSSEESGSIGIGFAIPSNIAKRVADEIIADGAATHGLLGASVRDASGVEGATEAGAYIAEVTDGGAAAAAGLQAGDVVTSFNGVPITSATDLTAQVRAAAADSTADVTYVRNGKQSQIEVTLGTLAG